MESNAFQPVNDPKADGGDILSGVAIGDTVDRQDAIESMDEDVDDGSGMFDEFETMAINAGKEEVVKVAATKKSLMEHLRIDTDDALTSWMTSTLLRPMWERLFINYVYRNRANVPKKDDVFREIERGVGAGNTLYTYPDDHDETSWSAIQHLALFVYTVRQKNSQSVDGVFYGKQLTKAQMNEIVWGLYVWISHDYAPSRAGRRFASKVMGPLRSKARAVQSDLKRKRAETSPQADESPAKKTRQHKSRSRSPVPGGVLVASQQPLNDTSSIASAAPETSFDAENQYDAPTPGQFHEENDEPEEIGTPSPAPRPRLPERHHWRQEIVANATPIKRRQFLSQAEALQFDLPRAVQYKKILKFIVRSTPAPTVPDDEVPTDLETTSEEPFPAVLNAMDHQRFLQTEDTNWNQLLKDDLEDVSTTIIPTDESVRNFELQQRWFDNKAYQRQDVQEACQFLNIPNPAIPRIPGMHVNVELKFWQPVAAKAIKQMEDDKKMRGAILADVVGLGKTWITIAYLQARYNQFKLTPAAQRPPASPVLIVVPATLVYQWAQEIKRVSTNLKVKVYYGRKDGKHDNSFDVIEDLTKNSAIFNGKSRNAGVVVITSYHSYNQRNGPLRLKSWRMSEKKMTSLMAGAIINDPNTDGEWPGDLAGLFSVVVLDEAQLVKNMNAMVGTAIDWSAAPFYLLLTATPIYNSVMDFKGFERFIFPTQDLWDDASLTAMGLETDINPFELPDGHPGQALMATTKATSKYIWHESVPDALKGERLGKIWRQCLIRRTLSSTIPFDSDRNIGGDIPPCQYLVVDCQFSPEELAVYKRLAEPNRQKLFIKKDGRIVFNMAKFRMLSLGATWIYFPWVAGSVKAKHIPLAIDRAKNKELFKWWASKAISQERQALEKIRAHVAEKGGRPEAFPDPPNFDPDADDANEMAILHILRGSPRYRSFLKRVAEQVLILEEKALVFCSFPADLVSVFALLRSFNIEAQVLHAKMSPAERESLIKQFTTANDECPVLITTFALNSSGLNLQTLCRNLHMLDTPTSESTSAQAIGRLWRLGQQKIVKVYEYHVPDTFSSRQVLRNAAKAIPGLVAQLDKALYCINTDDEGNLVMENWGESAAGDLINWSKGEDPPLGTKLLSPDEVLMRIQRLIKDS